MIGIRRSHCIPHEAIDLQIGFSNDRAVPFEPGGGLAEPAGQALAGFICKGLSKAEQGNQIGVRKSLLLRFPVTGQSGDGYHAESRRMRKTIRPAGQRIRP